MAQDLATVRKSIDAALKQDGAGFVTPDEIQLHIDNAIIQINQDRPFVKVADITGDGTRNYGLPADFAKGFSIIEAVEYPEGEDRPRFRRESDDWIEYEDPTLSPTLRLRFFTLTPSATETIRVTYTTTYTLNTTTTNLDEIAYLATVYKTMVFVFNALGSRFTQSNDPTILADAVNYGAAGQNFIFLGADYEKRYRQIIGINKDVTAAGFFAETDVVFSHGEDLLWHPLRTR